jgi:hypothetical protein
MPLKPQRALFPTGSRVLRCNLWFGEITHDAYDGPNDGRASSTR